MKRRELERNAVVGVGIAGLRTLADARDGMGIAIIIARRILGGARGLAPHVEAREFGLFLVGALYRGVDRPAHPELFAELPHSHPRRPATRDGVEWGTESAAREWSCS